MTNSELGCDSSEIRCFEKLFYQNTVALVIIPQK